MSDWDEESNIRDIPDYPDDWPPEQRVGAYWYALNFTGIPSNTSGWHTVWNLALREQERRANR